MVVSIALGRVSSLRHEVEDAKKSAAFSDLHMSAEMLAELDSDNNGIDEFEFVVGSLLMMGKVSVEDLQLIISKFRELDVDGSGTLNRDDLVTTTQDEPSGGESGKNSRAVARVKDVKMTMGATE